MDVPPAAALSIDDLVRIHRVLLASASFRLWERWMLVQPNDVKQAIRRHERELAEQARAQAQAVAGELDSRRARRDLQRVKERSQQWRATM